VAFLLQQAFFLQGPEGDLQRLVGAGRRRLSGMQGHREAAHDD
jgi:hypothetical protein